MKQFPPFSDHFIVCGNNGPIEYQYPDSTPIETQQSIIH